jgi:RNA polymerase sigma factor FliA
VQGPFKEDVVANYASQPSAEEMLEIWTTFKADQSNEQLRNRLIEIYLPLVKYNGERIWSRLPDGVELDDLTSAGTFGLMDAIDAFDMSRGVKFETYCVPRIRGAMLDELRTMDWVPRLVRSKASKLNEAVKTLEAKLGRAPADAEVAAHMGLSHEEFEKLLVDANAVRSGARPTVRRMFARSTSSRTRRAKIRLAGSRNRTSCGWSPRGSTATSG